MRRTAARLWERLGRRGSALLFFSMLDVIYAFSLANPPAEQRQSASMRWTADVAPLWLWATVWGVVGLICFVQAWMDNDRVAFAAAIAVKVVWGGLFIAGAIAVGLERAYVGAAVWLALAAFVAIISTWPEHSGRDLSAPVAEE